MVAASSAANCDNGLRLAIAKRARWWRRCGTPGRFRYEDASGARVTDRDALARIRALVIPPAWTEVRIAPSPRSRVQALGVDALGRVQYRYDPAFALRQQMKKYDRMLRFAEALPKLRRVTNEHIASAGLGRERVLAVIVRLINDLYFRVGNERNVQRYRTFGITTLRRKHLTIKSGGRLEFAYTGKHHIALRKVLVDVDLATLVRAIRALPGPRLFSYRDPQGRVRPLTARDVNEYIKSACGADFTAKDFRTWGGTLAAATALAEIGPAPTLVAKKRAIVRAIRVVAERLGNTPAVCRKCYVHPTVIERFADGVTLETFRPRAERYVRRRAPEYDVEELALLKLLTEPVHSVVRAA